MKGRHRVTIVERKPDDTAINRTYPPDGQGPHNPEGPVMLVSEEKNREYWKHISEVEEVRKRSRKNGKKKT